MGKEPYAVFRGADDELWFWMLTGGSRRFGALRAALPGAPDAQTQANYVGSSGDWALSEGYRFYRIVKKAVAEHRGRLGPDDAILDFGCGWGRIIRFFLKDVPSANLVGVDVAPTAIEMCRGTIPWCRFERTPALPPTGLGAESFNVIYLYSVISHLSEHATDAWVSEFHRLLRPGGIMVATVRSRDFITECQAYRDGKASGYEAMGRAFLETEEWLARFDRGEYCYAGTGGGENRSADFYGEACIPRPYVEDRWSNRFWLRDFLSPADAGLVQSVIVAQKR
jgi:SAM-dependent methyltransferase